MSDMNEVPKKSPAERKAEAIKAVKDRAEQEAFEFFHDRYDIAYATVPVRDHRETWRIRENKFRLWVMDFFYRMYGTAPRAWVKDAIDEFEMHAQCGGSQQDVFVRLGQRDGNLYLDLTNDAWQAIEISADGWRIMDDPPVKFRRTIAMKALPYPQDGGSIQSLVSFLNCARRDDAMLILTWLTYTLRLGAPYPVLTLSGSQGSGKSSITRALRAIVDPSEAALASPARNARDLAIMAPQSHIVTMDNLSDISQELSDMICRVASGGSHKERAYYTNDGSQSTFTFRQPIILNGIGIDNLSLRADLLDRMILIHYEPMKESQRRDETTLWQEFELLCPKILGALLDVACEGIRHVNNVRLAEPPRMADFARWGIAVEQALGFRAGEFMAAYSANIEAASDTALEASPIAWLLHAFLLGKINDNNNGHVTSHERREFHGTALQLLQALHGFVGQNGIKRWNEPIGEMCLVLKDPRFPKSANQLSGEIARIVPNLKRLGITVECGRKHAGRYIHLTLRPIDTIVTPSRVGCPKCGQSFEGKGFAGRLRHHGIDDHQVPATDVESFMRAAFRRDDATTTDTAASPANYRENVGRDDSDDGVDAFPTETAGSDDPFEVFR